MPQVDGTLIRQRAASLRERAARHQQAFLDSRIGHDDEVLMETGGIGHSRQFARVRIEGPHSQAPAGTVCPVRITAREGDVLIAEKRA